jgi:creatinine amidohydrolase
VYPTKKHWVPLSGVLSSAKGSTAEKGAMMAKELAARMATAVGDAFK